MEPSIAVLIIDDEPKLRHVVGIVLKRRGHTVIEAPDGDAGLEAAKVAGVDVIILDIMMPGIDGWDVLRRLKADAETAKIPVLIFSARDSEYDRTLGIALGAEDYIEKPFDAGLLERKLVRLVQSARDREDK